MCSERSVEVELPGLLVNHKPTTERTNQHNQIKGDGHNGPYGSYPSNEAISGISIQYLNHNWT